MSICLLDTLNIAVDHTSSPMRAKVTDTVHTVQVTTRTALGVQVLAPAFIHIVDRKVESLRVRWDVATATLYVEGTLTTGFTDMWTTLGSLPIVVGLETTITVYAL